MPSRRAGSAAANIKRGRGGPPKWKMPGHGCQDTDAAAVVHRRHHRPVQTGHRPHAPSGTTPQDPRRAGAGACGAGAVRRQAAAGGPADRYMTDFEGLLTTLSEAGVEFVLVGGVDYRPGRPRPSGRDSRRRHVRRTSPLHGAARTVRDPLRLPRSRHADRDEAGGWPAPGFRDDRRTGSCAGGTPEIATGRPRSSGRSRCSTDA